MHLFGHITPQLFITMDVSLLLKLISMAKLGLIKYIDFLIPADNASSPDQQVLVLLYFVQLQWAAFCSPSTG